jgi:hypothetical protein
MRFPIPPCVALLLLVCCGCHSNATTSQPDASYQPHIDAANFKSKVDHPYFPLAPGTVFRYVERDGDEDSEIETTVTDQPRVVMGVT